MNYIKGNKEAWEEVFDNKLDGWGEEVTENLRDKSDFYIQPCIKKILQNIDLSNKKVAQFCCNNGRELLSISKHYSVNGIGFDIAENLLEQGQKHANAMQLPCEFVAANVLDIDDKYTRSFDVILFTIGAITWFEDLDALFQVVSKCLKAGGIMILRDFHPIMNMLPLPGEESFNSEIPVLLEDKYFTKVPWIENSGMGYISGEFDSKTFISFSHSVSKIMNAIISADMQIRQFNEFDYDVGLTDAYDDKGLPLSMLVVANKID